MKEKTSPDDRDKKRAKTPNVKREKSLDSAAGIPGAGLFNKKNEYAVIFLGAALLSVVIVFFFFRTGDNSPDPAPSPLTPESSVQSFEQRIDHIESILMEKLGSGTGTIDTGQTGTEGEQSATELETYRQRMDRLETAFSVKFDSLAERMDTLERSMQELSRKIQTRAPAAPMPAAASPSAQTGTPAVKKTLSTKKEAHFHTVQKGETLWSISKKYNTTVAQLRKLNQLSENEDIYPGTNILVR